MRTIRPIKDRILVKQQAPKEKLSNGLYLPAGSRDLYDDIGEVLAVGPDVKDVQPGQVVRFTRRPASHLGEVSDEWKDLLMLRDEDIIGVVEAEIQS